MHQHPETKAKLERLLAEPFNVSNPLACRNLCNQINGVGRELDSATGEARAELLFELQILAKEHAALDCPACTLP